MSDSSNLPIDSSNTPSPPISKELLNYIQKNILPILFMLATSALFFYTWSLQNSCNPIFAFGNYQTSSCIQITLKPETIKLIPGKQATVNATIDSRDSRVPPELRWRSDNSRVVSIQEGSSQETVQILGHRRGEAIITANLADRHFKSNPVKVEVEDVNIQVAPRSLKLSLNNKNKNSVSIVSAIVMPEMASQGVNFTSKDPNIIAVEPIKHNKAKIIAVNIGKTIIRATSEEDTTKFVEIPVEVNKVVMIDRVEIKVPNSSPIYSGQHKELVAQVFGEGVNSEQISWEVSDSSIAELSILQGSSVQLNARKSGNITITAKSEQDPTKTATLDIGIREPEITKVEIRPQGSLRLDEGDEIKLCAKVNANGQLSDKTVTWSSGDRKIATIDAKSGQLKAIKRGKTFITATSNADQTKSNTIELQIPKTLSRLALIAGGVVAVGTMVLAVPPPAAIALGTATTVLINQWQGNIPGCS